MRRAFFANCRSSSAKLLTFDLNLRLLDRSVLPVLRHRCTRWPANAATFNEIGTIQRKMVASIMRLPMHHVEDPSDYVRRRHRAVSNIIAEHGAWNSDYCRRLISWDAHCRRERNRHSWAAKLVSYHGEDWLAMQRALVSQGSGTRALRGFPSTRWHEGIVFAKRTVYGSAARYVI